MSVKSIAFAKKVIVQILTHVFVTIVGIWGIFDDSVFLCRTITNATDSASTITTNTVSIKFDDEKARYTTDCYTSHTFLLVTILLFIIVITGNQYGKKWIKITK